MIIERGVSLSVVQAVLGHSSTAVTEIYTHLRPEHVKQEMQRAFS
jgi:site-specific recombinase XerD